MRRPEQTEAGKVKMTGEGNGPCPRKIKHPETDLTEAADVQ